MDPKATGQVISLSSGRLAKTNSMGPGVLSIDERMRDGCNIYEYLRGDAWVHSDALGLASEKALDGYAVHAEVEIIYAANHPGHECTFGTMLTQRLGLPIKPDIVNFTSKTWADVKPFSPSGLRAAAATRRKYSLLLGSEGYSPDSSWIPTPPTVIANGKIFVLDNVGGIIFYHKLKDDSEDINIEPFAVAAFLYLANIERLGGGATTVGRLVGSLLFGGGSGANGVGASLSIMGGAQIETGVATAESTAVLGF